MAITGGILHKQDDKFCFALDPTTPLITDDEHAIRLEKMDFDPDYDITRDKRFRGSRIMNNPIYKTTRVGKLDIATIIRLDDDYPEDGGAPKTIAIRDIIRHGLQASITYNDGTPGSLEFSIASQNQLIKANAKVYMYGGARYELTDLCPTKFNLTCKSGEKLLLEASYICKVSAEGQESTMPTPAYWIGDEHVKFINGIDQTDWALSSHEILEDWTLELNPTPVIIYSPGSSDGVFGFAVECFDPVITVKSTIHGDSLANSAGRVQTGRKGDAVSLVINTSDGVITYPFLALEDSVGTSLSGEVQERQDPVEENFAKISRKIINLNLAKLVLHFNSVPTP